MKKVKWIVVALIVAAVVGGFIYVEATKSLPVTAAAVEEGPIAQYVEERAKTDLPRIYRLTMPLDGRILPIQLTPGDRVTKGRVAAEMEDADLKTAVASARARINEIEARIALNEYDQIEKTVLKESHSVIEAAEETVKSANAKIVAGKEEVEFAQWLLDAARKLKAAGDTAEVDLKSARRDYVKARVQVASDQFTASAVKAIKEAVDLGPKYVDKWLGRKDLNGRVLAERKQSAQIALDKALRDLEKAKIKSPVDGVVLKRHVRNLRALPAGAPLLDLGRLDRLKVVADILSEDAVLIKVGDPVEIYGAAIGPDPIHGRVQRVDPQGAAKISSLGVEQQRVAVHVALNREDLAALRKKGRDLGVDYRVRVRVITEQKDQALIVPRPALFRDQSGAWRVFVLKGGRAESVEVAVGLTNDRRAEITKGVSAGEKVIVAPPKTLTSGSRVKEAGKGID